MKATEQKNSDSVVDNSNYIIDDIPLEFICPITMSIMKHPLMSRSGQNYERSAIVDWLANGNDTCPLTRQPLTLHDLLRNRWLETKIKQWKAIKGTATMAKMDDVDHTDYTDDDRDDDEEDQFKRHGCFLNALTSLQSSPQDEQHSTSPPITTGRTRNSNANNYTPAISSIRRGPMRLLQRLPGVRAIA